MGAPSRHRKDNADAERSPLPERLAAARRALNAAERAELLALLTSERRMQIRSPLPVCTDSQDDEADTTRVSQRSDIR